MCVIWVQWRKRMNWSYKQNCIKSVSNRVNQLLPEFPEVNIINANRAVFPILSFILFASFFFVSGFGFLFLGVFSFCSKKNLSLRTFLVKSTLSSVPTISSSTNRICINRISLFLSPFFFHAYSLFSIASSSTSWSSERGVGGASDGGEWERG